jgi:uncharacterized protein
MADDTPHYPGRAPIEAYGNGGFRFADMSHQGSLLCLPSGIMAWHATDAARLVPDDFAAVLGEPAGISLVLLGTGARQVFPGPDVRTAFRAAAIGLEAMDTGAACRTYNVLLAEGRPIAAALIAVA